MCAWQPFVSVFRQIFASPFANYQIFKRDKSLNDWVCDLYLCTCTAALVPGLVWKACGAPHCALALVEPDPVKETRQEKKKRKMNVATLRMTQHAVCHADSHVTVVPGY